MRLTILFFFLTSPTELIPNLSINNTSNMKSIKMNAKY